MYNQNMNNDGMQTFVYACVYMSRKKLIIIIDTTYVVYIDIYRRFEGRNTEHSQRLTRRTTLRRLNVKLEGNVFLFRIVFYFKHGQPLSIHIENVNKICILDSLPVDQKFRQVLCMYVIHSAKHRRICAFDKRVEKFPIIGKHCNA